MSKPRGSKPSVPPAPAWPNPQREDIARLSSIIYAYYNLPIGAKIERIPEALYELTGARRYDKDRSVWAWISAWCRVAEGWGAYPEVLRAAAFVFEWDREYTSGPGIMVLGKPKPEDKDTIGAAADVAWSRTDDWDAEVVHRRTVRDVYQMVIRWTMRDYIEIEEV